MSRGLKQAIYGAGFLLFFSAVVGGIYALMFRAAPTCFDSKRNGAETGIDCGGTCVPCAQKYVRDIVVKNVITFAINGKVAAVADIGNPNDDYGFRVVDCTMTARDGSGVSVGSAALREFIYDRKTKGNRFVVGVIDAQGAEVSDVRVACSGSDAAFRDEFVEPNIVINRSSTGIAGLKNTSVVVSGSVKNNDLVSAAKVVVTALVYDVSGIPLGVSKTELDGLQVKEERVFKLLFPETTPIDKVDTTKTRVFVDSIK